MLTAARDRKAGHKHRHDFGGDASDDEEGGGQGADGESFSVQPGQLEGYRKRRRATLEERYNLFLC